MIFIFTPPTHTSNVSHYPQMATSPDPFLHFFPELENLPLTTLKTKLSVVALTCSLFFVISVISYFLSYFFVDTFRTKLRSKEKVFWCLAFIRAVFGFIAIIVGVWCLVLDDTFHKDIVNGANVSSYLAVYFTLGFFLFECVALLLSNIYFRFFDAFLFVHHFLSLIGFIVLAIYDGKGHYFPIQGLLLEGTTPFSCFCWMLLKCKMSHLPIWKINQLVLVHLFHCRTTLEGYLFYKYFQQWENVSANMPLAISVLLLTQLTLQFFVLTPYWTYKKMNQLFNPVDWNHPELLKSTVVANGTHDVTRNSNRRKKPIKEQ